MEFENKPQAISTLVVPVEKRPITFKGQTVITTEMLASVYKTTATNISNNFNNNKGKFEEGKHYILLQGNDLKEFKNQSYDIGVVKKNTSQLYLWTERGASRHCKILDTDKAWEQFDYLEDTYFKSKQSVSSVFRIIEEFKSEIDLKIEELAEQGKENHRPSHKTKLNWNSIIKSYAVCKGDEEVLKQMALDHFNAAKWEDIPYARKGEVVKFIRCMAEDLKMFVQESIYGE